MTYNPRSVFQSYEQYGRAKTKQAQSSKPKNANQQAARTMSSVGVGGLGGRTTTSAAQKIQDRFRRETQRDSGSTYDEVPQTITTGLGSKKAQDTKDESMSVGTKIDRAFLKVMTSLIPDFSPPKEQAVFPLEVYGGPLFRVPTPTPVNIQELDDAARDTSRTFSPKAMEPPTLPTTATDSDTGLTTPRGLMSPPTMTQPEKPRGLMGIPRALARANAVPTAAYQVQSGDTLSEIAAATGTTVKELADLNQISDVDVIEAGADLQIPIKRLEDEAVVTQATSMEDLKPIKASYTVSEPSIKPDATDPDAEFYSSFREGITPESMMQLTGAGKYDSAEGMSELEILARTIEREAGNQSKKGKLAVGAVIQNRVDKQSWMGKDIKSVILKPGQFSPWNSYTNFAEGRQGKDMLGESAKPSKDSYEAAEKILSGDYVDPTLGATHFVNPKEKEDVDWYDPFVKNKPLRIGDHQFGSPDDPNWKGRSGINKSIRPRIRPLGLPTGTDI